MGRIAVVSAIPDGRFLRGAPSIWPKGRGLEARDAIPLSIGLVEGRVTAELIHARTGFVKQRLEFKNLITDAGLNAFGSGSTLADFLINGYMAVGTGNAAPTNADVALQTPTGVRIQTAGGGTESFGWGAANLYSYRRVVREYSEAQSNGNLTEFGMFNAAAGGIMLARQLFKDGTGTPTTITKTSDDKLRITWEFRLYPSQIDTTGTVNIGGVNYDFTGRIASLGDSVAWGYGTSVGMLNKLGNRGANIFYCVANNATALGALTANSPTGGTQTAPRDSATVTAYTPGSFTDENTAVWNVGSANFTGGVPGVRGFTFQTWGNGTNVIQQMILSTHIPKVNTQKLTMVFRSSWGRH